MQRYKLVAQASNTAIKTFETFGELEQFVSSNKWQGTIELDYLSAPTQYGTMDVELKVGNWRDIVRTVEFSREHGKWYQPTGDTYPL